ncbi:hypothetical protein QNI16_35050 [Cytophagaceae bacterium YF14B1]|uniref:Outer membrane protein beta-barrel domain-containing protein n=1 Tax=Xanthocytophaga flava TaxID=3048013 RepID=A0AAE3QUP9_9BACT|nr:outer membrane beta-barrel protein [Xanthocytophaga flavus]MDJ1485752.1 hypothetical protein [Xanthocytophaga flavus]
MKIILSFLLFISAFPAFCQVSFDKGYILDNSGKKIECLIENKDWVKNPETFRYKLTENDSPQSAHISNIKEFAIENYAKFVRASVQLDTSKSRVLSKFSRNHAPEWTSATLFLKVLAEGKATLYYYEATDLVKFFFSTPTDTSIRQLVYKEYTISNSTVGENAYFRQQLNNEVNCGNVSRTYLERIRYSKSELTKHFMRYNACMGQEVVKPKIFATRDLLNFRVTPGINYSSLSVNSDVDRLINVTFDNHLFFRAGLEIEYILPFNKNKWSVFAEPTYQYYKADQKYNIDYKAAIDYQSLEFPIGVRYAIFLKTTSKIFVNAMYVPGAVIHLSNSTITYSSDRNGLTYPYKLKTGGTAAFGAGYALGNLSLEARYYMKQDLLNNYIYFGTSYQRLTIVLGYRFVKLKSKVKTTQ